jgi:hypothetical protein
VLVDAAVNDNATVAGRTVRLSPKADVGGEAVLTGNSVIAEGHIARDLKIGATTARIGADVGGGVEAQARDVSVLPGAVIRGDLVVRAPEPPTISPDAQVLGEVRYESTAREAWSGWIRLFGFSFLALLILGWVALAVAPSWASRVAGTLRRRLGMSAAAGVAVLVLLPLLAGALLITVIGIPLSIVLLALYAAGVVVSGVIVGYRLGEWMLGRAHRPDASRWGRMALGVFIVALGVTLPAVGWLVALVVVMLGTGAIALEARDWHGRSMTTA